MNKMNLAKKAYELYSIENLNADEIAAKLGVSRRTVFNWMKNFKWQKKKINLGEIQNTFPTELQEFVMKIMQKVSSDMDNKRKLSKEELYSIANITDILFKLEKQNTKSHQKSDKKTEPSKGLPHELIRQIERDILGLDID